MGTRHVGTIGFLAAMVTLFTTANAGAQMIVEGQTAFENASPGAVRLRAPGNMVTAGLARAQAFSAATAGGIEITEPARETSVWSQALADSITILFDGLNQGIVLFENLLLARAGRPPVIPTGFLPDTSVGDDSDNMTTDLDDLDLGDADLGDLLDRFGSRGPK